MPVTFDQLNQVYLAYFGRPVDDAGFNFYTNSGGSMQDVAAAFAASAESQALYGGNVTAMVTAIYRNLFNRDPEAAGLSYWTGQISSGAFSPPEAALVILQAAVSSDATAVANKLSAASAFFNAMDTVQEKTGYAGADAAAATRAFIAAVDHTPASLVAARAGVDAALASAAGSSLPPPPTTIALDRNDGGVYDNIAGTKVIVNGVPDHHYQSVTFRFQEDHVDLTLNLGRDDPSPAGATAVQTSFGSMSTATLAGETGHSLNGVSSLTINSAGVSKTNVANGHFFNQNVVVWESADDLTSLTMTGDSTTTLFIRSGGKLSLIDLSALTADVNLGLIPFAPTGVSIIGGQGRMVVSGTPGHDTILVGTGGGSISGSAGGDSISIAANATGQTTLTYWEGETVSGRTFPNAFEVVNGFVNYATRSVAGDLSDAVIFRAGSGVMGVPPIESLVLEDTSSTRLGNTGISLTSHAGVVQFGMSSAAAAPSVTTLLDALGAWLPSNRNAAFEWKGSTYVLHAALVTPGPDTNSIVQLVGVTGINALSIDGTTGPHTLLVGTGPMY